MGGASAFLDEIMPLEDRYGGATGASLEIEVPSVKRARDYPNRC